MSDTAMLSVEGFALVQELADSAAGLFGPNASIGDIDRYLGARGRLEVAAISHWGRKAEARNATPEQFLRQVITDNEEWECNEDAADRLAGLARQAKAILGDNK